jgi:hypothetical protein
MEIFEGKKNAESQEWVELKNDGQGRLIIIEKGILLLKKYPL